MRALVLDFDGVLFDSARESFAVARRTYLDLRPGSPLALRDPAALYEGFLALMPLGNRAEDYGTALAALEGHVRLEDQPDYDAFRAAQDAPWLATYHRRFYEVREALSREDPELWLGLMPPYRPFVELLRRRVGEVAYAIATSKDRRSVRALLSHHGLLELFPSHLVLDKEAGATKDVHHERLGAILGLSPAQMTFVDDKVNHLDCVARLGVRCALAAWGYNTRREHDLARGRGYLVCSLESAEGCLFGD